MRSGWRAANRCRPGSGNPADARELPNERVCGEGHVQGSRAPDRFLDEVVEL